MLSTCCGGRLFSEDGYNIKRNPSKSQVFEIVQNPFDIRERERKIKQNKSDDEGKREKRGKFSLLENYFSLQKGGFVSKK